MKTVEYWLWWITDPATGKRKKTRHRMKEADALERHPGAEKVEGSCEERRVPESDVENWHVAPNSRKG